MPIRGVRGAIQANDNETQAILMATRELLIDIQAANPTMRTEDFASVIFTVTPDLTATFPAFATRSLRGWKYVPLLCASEISVPEGLPRCIRVLIHWNTDLAQDEIKHVYSGAATCLRPDLPIPTVDLSDLDPSL
jgi:chorismate mutase